MGNCRIRIKDRYYILINLILSAKYLKDLKGFSVGRSLRWFKVRQHRHFVAHIFPFTCDKRRMSRNIYLLSHDKSQISIVFANCHTTKAKFQSFLGFVTRQKPNFNRFCELSHNKSQISIVFANCHTTKAKFQSFLGIVTRQKSFVAQQSGFVILHHRFC